ncbi:dicarboxylate/amino acid:cation symporter [Thermoflavimicrobium dichotomicum]|uniref:Aerobic C4-dicarboxylate transport protein n=1 Tax=Thermoflavimicrobium dichotomicum TaxID=46223 RepID=A0A1I3U852_9BACL|nr:dicarboxylate/amino acid:cation symporter [Thermoflavimicrobium dichotomicum]SFJ79075.1 aerobic C4-dicarboxylate transport protein [Thermoflavimicrobium dichotomicum]
MKKLWKNLTFQVITAIILAVILGILWPETAKSMEPLSKMFINLIKMVIPPIIFLTIVLGISKIGNMKKVGRVGGKAILYFEIVTTFALLIGLLVAHFIKPGAGLNTSQFHLTKESVSQYISSGEKMDWVDFFVHIIPSSMVDAFAKGDILQVVFFSILFGFALAALGKYGEPIIDFFERLSTVFFKIVSYVIRVAPIGAFGAMAVTIGKFGPQYLYTLGKLMLSVYMTMFLFVFIVLGIICRIYKFSLWNYLRYIKEELIIVLGTSSSESVLPRMLDKMEKYGCSKSVVGMVIPTKYSFNLDGTSIYLSMAVLFLAQVYGVNLSITQQIMILGVLMITSKGAAAVTGGGFIVLASTISALHIGIPPEGLALLLGVDRFMSEARAIVNLIGNGIATIVVAKSENEFDEEKAKHALAHVSNKTGA